MTARYLELVRAVNAGRLSWDDLVIIMVEEYPDWLPPGDYWLDLVLTQGD